MWIVSCLDERINAIGDHTIRVEKTIRTIKGDSALMLENIDHVFHQSSSSPYLAAHKPALKPAQLVTYAYCQNLTKLMPVSQW